MMKVCPICNRRLGYTRYNVKLLNDSLPHCRFYDNHLLCRKKLKESEKLKIDFKEFFEEHGIIVLDI